MRRRDFLVAAAAAVGTGWSTQAEGVTGSLRLPAARRFGLQYAPHFGIFKQSAGPELADQLRFAAEQGFTAWEDRNIGQRPIELQRRIASTMQSLQMQMGAIAVSSTATAYREPPNAHHAEDVLRSVRRCVEVATRVGARWLLVDAGNAGPERSSQHSLASDTELWKRCVELVEPYNLVIVLNPWSISVPQQTHGVQGTDDAWNVCRQVDSPSCKFLVDLYQLDLRGSDILSELDRCWSEIGYLHCADSRGRKEPGTGEIDYPRIFRYLQARRFQGIVGMEHGNALPGVEGERAVIEAYLRADRS